MGQTVNTEDSIWEADHYDRVDGDGEMHRLILAQVSSSHVILML